MKTLEERVLEDFQRSNELSKEFDQRFNALKDEGLVDFKMKLMPTDEASTEGVVAVLNNVLRLRSEGAAKPLILAI